MSVSILNRTAYCAFVSSQRVFHNVYTKGKLGQVFKLMLNTLSLGSTVMLKNLIELLETSMSVVQKHLKR